MSFLLVGEGGGGVEDLGDVISGVQCGAFREAGIEKPPSDEVPVGAVCCGGVRSGRGTCHGIPLPGAPVVRGCQCDGP